MTVAELIEKLKEMPQDLKVYQSDERRISCGDPHLETIEDHKGQKIQIVNIWYTNNYERLL